MKVLMITGDKRFGPGNERYELQKNAVDRLEVLYWGKGNYWPTLPEGRFDVVTVQDPFWRGAFAIRAAWRKSARLNVQVHTDLSVYSSFKNIVMQIVLRHADSVRVVSEKIKQQVLQIAPHAKITVLPVFVDLSKFKNIVRTPHAEKTILWIGRYEDEKDPLQAIEVLEKVVAEGVQAKLIMIGDGTLKENLLEKANHKPHIEVHGWEDAAHYLTTADVVLCTSKHESFGASIIEALAARVPVVAPDVGVAKEAGATIMPRRELYKGVIDVLTTGKQGQLQLSLLDKDTWAKQWAASLA